MDQASQSHAQFVADALKTSDKQRIACMSSRQSLDELRNKVDVSMEWDAS